MVLDPEIHQGVDRDNVGRDGKVCCAIDHPLDRVVPSGPFRRLGIAMNVVPTIND